MTEYRVMEIYPGDFQVQKKTGKGWVRVEGKKRTIETESGYAFELTDTVIFGSSRRAFRWIAKETKQERRLAALAAVLDANYPREIKQGGR